MRDLLTINTHQAQQLSAFLTESEKRAGEILGVKVSLQIASHRVGTIETNAIVTKALELVAEEYDVDITDIISTSRLKNIAAARSMFWLIAHEMSNTTLAYLGKVTGGRNHTTVIWGIRSMQNHIDTEDDTKTIYTKLKRILNSI